MQLPTNKNTVDTRIVHKDAKAMPHKKQKQDTVHILLFDCMIPSIIRIYFF
jgi:hypothetical protein